MTRMDRHIGWTVAAALAAIGLFTFGVVTLIGAVWNDADSPFSEGSTRVEAETVDSRRLVAPERGDAPEELLRDTPAVVDPENRPTLVGQGFGDLRKEMALAELNTEDLRIPKEEIRSGGPPVDGIPALTQPRRIPVREASGFESDDRIIAVTIDGNTVGYPVAILNHHEIVNDVVGGTPVAVTFCPLCDSAMVADRRLKVTDDDGSTITKTLEFGVSGLLANSNLLLYDRSDDALWSQLLMEAVSGPHAGEALRVLPFRMLTWDRFAATHPDAEIVSRDTGYARNYRRNPYDRFLTSDDLMFPPSKYGEALPAKTLGLGIHDGEQAIFIARDAVRSDRRTIDTSAGPVVITGGEAGVSVLDKPENVRVTQTFYYAWSAYHPETEVIDE